MKSTLTPEDLDLVAGSDLNMPTERGGHYVDMSDYTCVFYSLARGAACAYANWGYSREAAIQAVNEFYASQCGVVMENTDQCITQEWWDRLV